MKAKALAKPVARPSLSPAPSPGPGPRPPAPGAFTAARQTRSRRRCPPSPWPPANPPATPRLRKEHAGQQAQRQDGREERAQDAGVHHGVPHAHVGMQTVCRNHHDPGHQAADRQGQAAERKHQPEFPERTQEIEGRRGGDRGRDAEDLDKRESSRRRRTFPPSPSRRQASTGRANRGLHRPRGRPRRSRQGLQRA